MKERMGFVMALLFAASCPLLGQQTAQPGDTLPSAWPLTVPTAERIAAVRLCDLAVALTAPVSSDSTRACLLARSIVAELRTLSRGAMPNDSTRLKVIALGKLEPLFLLTNALFYSPIVGRAQLVQRPPVATQAVTSIALEYQWRGLGTPVDWSATVVASDSTARVTLKRNAVPDVVTNVPGALLQAIGPALTDLMPIAAYPNIQPCTDNSPDWKMTVTFRDGRSLSLFTNRANNFGPGGPWQMELDGQKYLQLSAALSQTIGRLSQAAALPFGSPRGMYCRVTGSVFGEAYPG